MSRSPSRAMKKMFDQTHPPLSALCNQKNLLRSQHAWSTSHCDRQNSTCFARVIINNKGNDLTFVDERHTEHERVSHRPPLSSVEQAKTSAAQPQVHVGSLVSHELTQPTCRSRSVGRRDGFHGVTESRPNVLESCTRSKSFSEHLGTSRGQKNRGLITPPTP